MATRSVSMCSSHPEASTPTSTYCVSPGLSRATRVPSSRDPFPADALTSGSTARRSAGVPWDVFTWTGAEKCSTICAPDSHVCVSGVCDALVWPPPSQCHDTEMKVVKKSQGIEQLKNICVLNFRLYRRIPGVLSQGIASTTHTDVPAAYTWLQPWISLGCGGRLVKKSKYLGVCDATTPLGDMSVAVQAVRSSPQRRRLAQPATYLCQLIRQTHRSRR